MYIRKSGRVYIRRDTGCGRLYEVPERIMHDNDRLALLISGIRVRDDCCVCILGERRRVVVRLLLWVDLKEKHPATYVITTVYSVRGIPGQPPELKTPAVC